MGRRPTLMYSGWSASEYDPMCHERAIGSNKEFGRVSSDEYDGASDNEYHWRLGCAKLKSRNTINPLIL